MTTTQKKKLNRADFMFANKTGEELMKKPGDINGIDFQIRNLTDCTVYLLDHTAQIMVDQCQNTTFIIGPVKGSIFIRDCSDCKISVACSQFRCRDLHNSTIYLYAANDPIIESSNNLVFAPYNIAYPLLDQHAQAAGMDTSINKWDLIFDFTKNESNGQLNFSILDPSKFKTISKEVEGLDQKPVLVFPYPQRYGGTLDDQINESNEKKGDDMMAFGFNTSQQEAEKKFQNQDQQQNSQNDIDQYMMGDDYQQQNKPLSETNSKQFGAFNQSLGESSIPFQSQNPHDQYSQMYSEDAAKSFNTQQQNFGFKPMQQNIPNIDDDDYTEEEKERINKAEQDRQEKMRQLYEKEQEEQQLKNDKKTQARDQLKQWQQERQKQLENRRKQNKQSEDEYHEDIKRVKSSSNPWERVIQNVEINANNYLGQVDVTRMRQAMISRKADITKSGGFSKQPF